MYNNFMCEKRDPVKLITQWMSDADWCSIFDLPCNTTIESKYHWLQVKILHRLISKKTLSLTDSKLLLFSLKLELEYIEHLFVDCPYV